MKLRNSPVKLLWSELNLEEPPPVCGVDCFEKLEQIGEGSYGQVYMAKEIKTGEIEKDPYGQWKRSDQISLSTMRGI